MYKLPPIDPNHVIDPINGVTHKLMTKEQETVVFWNKKGFVELKDGDTVWLYNPELGAYTRPANGWEDVLDLKDWTNVQKHPILWNLKKLHKHLTKGVS